MARIGTVREFLQEVERIERSIARAWQTSVERVRALVTVRAIEQAIRDNALDSIDELLLNRAALNQALNEIRAAYVAGGEQVERAIPPAGHRMTPGSVGFVFDVRDPIAEAWLASRSSQFIVEITREQLEGVRAVVSRGTELGRNPRRTALDIIGRINPRTGRREGGIVGLSGQMARWRNAAEEELSSPEGITNYLRRKRRDRRFDALVRRARREGRGLRADELQRVLGSYERRLLALRGETIARTESIRAFSAGRHESIRQAVNLAKIPPRFVKRVWDATGDARVRDDHSLMDETSVIGEETPFVMPDNSRMMHPGDSSLGAPAEQIINCRCYERAEIDFIGAEASRNE